MRKLQQNKYFRFTFRGFITFTNESIWPSTHPLTYFLLLIQFKVLGVEQKAKNSLDPYKSLIGLHFTNPLTYLQIIKVKGNDTRNNTITNTAQ